MKPKNYFVEHFNKLNRIMDNAHKYVTYEVEEKLAKEILRAEVNYEKGRLTDHDMDMIHSCFPLKKKAA